MNSMFHLAITSKPPLTWNVQRRLRCALSMKSLWFQHCCHYSAFPLRLRFLSITARPTATAQETAKSDNHGAIFVLSPVSAAVVIRFAPCAVFPVPATFSCYMPYRWTGRSHYQRLQSNETLLTINTKLSCQCISSYVMSRGIAVLLAITPVNAKLFTCKLAKQEPC